jgi:glutamate racemase
MKERELSIAVFDSGLGGISVLKELIRLLPNENFIYYGDTANAPYGVKSAEHVRCLTFSVYERLKAEGIKAFVIACNTATSVAVAQLREKYPEDIIIGVEPALKPAVLCKEHPTVAVLATPLTLKEEKFAALMQRFLDSARVIPFACPGLVEFVERGEIKGERLEEFLSELLAPLKEEKLDAVVLGCTHYPFVKDGISRVLGNDVMIFDGSTGTARETRRRLENAELLCDESKKGSIVFLDSSYPNDKNSNKSMLTVFGGEYICS